jgi:hypothetical protein
VNFFGGPCENRTHDQRIKSPLLYRTELTARFNPDFAAAIYCGLKNLAATLVSSAALRLPQSHAFGAGSRFHDFDPQHISDMLPGQNRSNFAFRLGFSTLATMPTVKSGFKEKRREYDN